MTTAINKRQQARHERALQELISNVPGNNNCADCSASNPGWTSWNLGIFLCMRCASLHRKLGTHISKVKSLSMDTWQAEQVDAMKSMGNTASNKVYNPRNVRASLPLDPDEIDTAMEQFIRQKYQRRTLTDGTTAARGNEDDRGPPPPPKPIARFAPNVRTTSAAYPSPFSSGRSSPASAGRAPSSIESKTLPPLPRNDVQQPPSTQMQPQPQPLAPQHTAPSYTPMQTGVQYSGMQATGGYANPFHRQMTSSTLHQPLEASFQSMQISQNTALTPELTGNCQPSIANSNPFLQTYTPPISPAPQTYQQMAPGTQEPPNLVEARNQFLQLSRSQTMPVYQPQPLATLPTQSLVSELSNPYSQYPSSTSQNPFYNNTPKPLQQHHTGQQPSFLSQSTEWHDVNTIVQPPSQMHQYQTSGLGQAQQYQASENHFAPQEQQLPSQIYVSPMRHDKSSILALYTQPHLAPARPAAFATETIHAMDAAVTDENEPTKLQRRSVTMPNPGSKNPFATLTSPTGHTSELIDPANGRHSPDAFRSLSSKSSMRL